MNRLKHLDRGSERAKGLCKRVFVAIGKCSLHQLRAQPRLKAASPSLASPSLCVVTTQRMSGCEQNKRPPRLVRNILEVVDSGIRSALLKPDDPPDSPELHRRILGLHEAFIDFGRGLFQITDGMNQFGMIVANLFIGRRQVTRP